VTATPINRALSRAAAELREAVSQARLAYEFSPNSYTYGGLNACIAAQEALAVLSGHLEDLARG
jgi:hypothetical protein